MHRIPEKPREPPGTSRDQALQRVAAALKVATVIILVGATIVVLGLVAWLAMEGSLGLFPGW